MATPIGHALAGYAVYCASAGALRQDRWAFLGLCAGMALAPDLDFVPGIVLGQPVLYHQGISHSLGAALGVSLGLAVLYGRRRGTVRANWGRFFLAYASHLILDLFGQDSRPPYGMPLFWPLDDGHYQAPFPIFWGIEHARSASTPTGEWIAAIFQPHNLAVVGLEVVVIFPVVLFIWSMQRTVLETGSMR